MKTAKKIRKKRSGLRSRSDKVPARVITPWPEVPERDMRPEANLLFGNLKKNLRVLEKLLLDVNDDGVYRYYHQSFKVFSLQHSTEQVVAELQALLPGRPLNEWFRQIIKDGTGKNFEQETNANWVAETQPIVNAYLHARFFLEIAIKYGNELAFPPNIMPSGWALILYLYNLR